MSGLSVTYNDERAQAPLQRLSQIVAKPRAALTGSAQALRRLIKDTFQDQRDPWGRPWARHALATVAARDRTGGGGSILLSLPDPGIDHPLPELIGHAMIREVHVYGPALNLGDDSRGEAQHIGLGTRLIERAKEIARAGGYRHIAVISAIGTREYYARLGFKLDGLYMTCALD